MTINVFLANFINWINSWVGNYGWSLVLFTVFIKLLLFPLDFKSRKSMRRMNAVQPKMAVLQKKYANDKDKLNQKMSELYRKEKINPLSGCVPLLLSFPVLIIMFGAMRYVANLELAKQTLQIISGAAENELPMESWLWIKNLWMPDSPWATVVADQQNLQMIPVDIWQTAIDTLSAGNPALLQTLGLEGANLVDTLKNNASFFYEKLIQMPLYQQEMARWAALPELNLLLFKLTFYQNPNGFFILPILAAVTQFLSTKLTPTAPVADGSKQASSGKFMQYFFPIFSLWLCSSYNAAFSAYWVVSNIIVALQSYGINKYFDYKEKQTQQGDSIVGEGNVK